jgi:hypothetical protein
MKQKHLTMNGMPQLNQVVDNNKVKFNCNSIVV